MEIYAIERAYELLADSLPDQGNAITTAIVDIGDEMSTISVLSSGKTVYMRDELFGGHQLTNMIMQYYKLNQSAAEKLKSSTDLPNDYEEKVLKPF